MPRKLLYSFLLLACALCERPALAANLRVVTFNAGLDRVLSLRSWSTVEDTFTRDARLGRAHLLALQEICLNQRTSLARFLQVMRFNHGVQYHFADYSNRRNGSCGKGQAIVSAYPIVAAGTLVLPRVGAHHAAIWADLRVEGPSYRRLRVYNVHLSNRQGWDLTPLEGRQRQVKAVMQIPKLITR